MDDEIQAAGQLEELAIRRRTGHAVNLMSEVWMQCKACGMWVREMITTEHLQRRNAICYLKFNERSVRYDL